MQQDATPESNSLSDRQLAAIPYLVASTTIKEAAEAAKVHRVTLHRWMNDPEFRAEYDSQRKEASELAYSELRGLMLRGTFVLAESMEDPNPMVRLRATHVAMSLGIKANDLEDVGKRLERLHDAFQLWSKKNPPHP